MKVYSYLQLMAKANDVIHEFMALHGLDNGSSIIEFYSQPFKPELITELFVGWEFDKCMYYNGVASIDCHCDDLGGYYCYAGIVIAPTPRTLDDFITDCQRAGIELEWKR